MASFMRAPITLKEVPTLTLLYKLGKLDASIGQAATLPANQRFNDMIVLAKMDLTRFECDAIVNAANRSLLGGGGIDGAIHRAAGNALMVECHGLNGCDTGDAKITKGYRLPAKHIIHTVGPVYWDIKDNGEDPSVYLKSCYVRSLDVARQNGCKSVAFPCISTGIYGYPNLAAAKVACRAVREYLEKQELEAELFGPSDVDTTTKDEGATTTDAKNETATATDVEEEGGVALVTEENKQVEGEKKAKPVDTEKVAEKEDEKKEAEKPGEEEKKEEVEKKEGDEKPVVEGDKGDDKEDKAATETETKDDKTDEKPFICKIEKVVFCTFLDKDMAAYEDILPAYFPPAPEVEGSLDKLQHKSEEQAEGDTNKTEEAAAAAEIEVVKQDEK